MKKRWIGILMIAVMLTLTACSAPVPEETASSAEAGTAETPAEEETTAAETTAAETTAAETTEFSGDSTASYYDYLGWWKADGEDVYYFFERKGLWTQYDSQGQITNEGTFVFDSGIFLLHPEVGGDWRLAAAGEQLTGEDGSTLSFCGAPPFVEDGPGGEEPEADLTCFPYEEPEPAELTEAQQTLYDEVWPLVEAVEDFHYEVSDYGYDFMEDLLTVYGEIVRLHPETEFYFELREINNDEGYLTAMESWYYCRWDPEMNEDREAVKAGIAAFEQRCEEIVAGLTDKMTAYEKYEYLAKVISENADYDYEGETTAAGSPWAGVMGGKCICQGYSVAMETLCKKADLYCRVVEGASRDVSHAWNLVKLPEGTYHVDITWADEQDEPGVGNWYTYFMLTQEQIEQDHEIWDGTVATGT